MTRIRMLLVTCVLFVPAIGLATTHTSKQVTVLHSPDGRECTFFMLIMRCGGRSRRGGGSPWFAGAPEAHVGYKEIVPFLMTARITGESVTVATSGTLACGACKRHGGPALTTCAAESR